MSNELEILLDKIQVKTNFSLEEISQKIGRTRPYLNKAKSKEGGNKKLIALLKDRFPDILQNDTKDDNIQLSGSSHGTSTATGTLTAVDYKDKYIALLEKNEAGLTSGIEEIKENLNKLSLGVTELLELHKEIDLASLAALGKKSVQILPEKQKDTNPVPDKQRKS